MNSEPIEPHVSLASPLAAVKIAVALGDRRQMEMAINISAADPPEVQDAMLQNALDRMDRIQARYDLEQLEKRFEETGRHLRNFLNAIPVAEQAEKHRTAVLNVELATKRDARKEAYEEGYNAHVSSGRKGTYEPKGALLSRLNGMDAEIRKVEEAIAALPNDTAQHKATTVTNIQKYQDDLRDQRRKINDLRTLAGLPAYELFMVEQEAKVEV